MSNIIKKNVPAIERLLQVAEEANELSHACLKLVRVFSQTNPTPVSEEEALEHLWEEIADVKCTVSQLDVPVRHISELCVKKEKRWEERIIKNGGTV